MRLASVLLSVTIISCAATVTLPANSASAPTFSANAFNNLLMLDTHLAYSDSTYGLVRSATGQYSLAGAYVRSAAGYVGIKTFRDGVSDGSYGSSPLSYYQSFATYGFKFVFIASGNTTTDLAKSLSLIDQVNQTPAATGRVTAIEGANEINNAPLCWGGSPCQSGLAGALNRQAALLSLVRSDTALPHISQVVYFTGWDGVAGSPGPDPVGSYADYNNQHPYPAFGTPPYFWLNRSVALGNTKSTAEKVMYTEMGYPVGPLYGTACNSGRGGVCWNNNNYSPSKREVSESVQARQTLDIPFDALLIGISKVGLYQLLTPYAEQSYKDDGFGLFHYRADGTLAPRLAATALHNLLTITADPGSVSYVSGLSYQVTGLPTTGYCPGANTALCTFTPSLALQKSNGQYLIAVWAEQNIWNADTHTEVKAKTYAVNILLPRVFSKIEIFDPMVGVTPVSTSGASNAVTVNVTDHPMIIQVSP